MVKQEIIFAFDWDDTDLIHLSKYCIRFIKGRNIASNKKDEHDESYEKDEHDASNEN